MTTNEMNIEKLNRLIQINEDRKAGYLKAYEQTDEPDLKALFDKYSKQSGMYIVDLGVAVESYGGVPTDKSSLTGDMYRAWMDIKEALATNERKAVLESCERGEDAAVSTYSDVLEDSMELDQNLIGIITMQAREIGHAHDEIKALRDSAKLN